MSVLATGCVFGDDLNDDDFDPPVAPEQPVDPEQPAEPEPAFGMVFALGNEADGNEVHAFLRGDDGLLSPLGAFPTGGLGRGSGLGSQTALVLSDDGEYLFAVNAGSDEISSFRVFPDHLALIDIVDSRGELPVSVTARGNRLYVVNAAGAGNVSGFALEDGLMIPIEGTTMPLSAIDVDTAAAQVALSPDGKLLAVTEKATNNLVTYTVDDDGTLSAPIVTPGSGQTPFGFEFTPSGWMIVSEAFGGADGASAVSSYDPARTGAIDVVSGSVANGQSAACWIEIAGGGRYAYTTNAASSTISGYRVGDDGSLTLFDDGGVTAALPAGSGPNDMAVSHDERFLYVLNGRSDTITGFRIEADGTLTALDTSVPVPASAVGLAGR